MSDTESVRSAWESFYVIVGSSAGALIGLQFVVMTLTAELPAAKSDALAGAAFASPSVVHFGVVLLLSAILCAPWDGLGAASATWGLLGLAGIVYEFIVARRMQGQKVYQPVLEDWMFHFVLPLAGYAVLAIAAIVARFDDRAALFAVAGAALTLLFTGIHNAWDTVVHQVFVMKQKE